ncbi:hypothetical protein [uncultured Aquimarina sp.]|uniref:hypothetical protein n=1 Tax=uncultured Aquimarina sp. TaxID=575652 RepID=UPI00261CA006|nr:hypothetical protein [uncultured Aquimarina sp.]
MLENTTFLSFGFVALVLLVMLWLNSAIKIGRLQITAMLAWTILLSVLALQGFFIPNDKLPPKLIFAMGPPLIFSIIFPFTKKGKKMIASINMERLTLIHSIRIIVELVFLYQLAELTLVSDIVTFHGRNFDVIPGLTAIIVWWLFFKKKKLSKKGLLLWNIISLPVLLFTISQAILSAPLPFQQFDFEQPTIAIFYFPFILLPGFVAPTVIFCHIAFFHKYRSLQEWKTMKK